MQFSIDWPSSSQLEETLDHEIRNRSVAARGCRSAVERIAGHETGARARIDVFARPKQGRRQDRVFLCRCRCVDRGENLNRHLNQNGLCRHQRQFVRACRNRCCRYRRDIRLGASGGGRCTRARSLYGSEVARKARRLSVRADLVAIAERSRSGALIAESRWASVIDRFVTLQKGETYDSHTLSRSKSARPRHLLDERRTQALRGSARKIARNELQATRLREQVAETKPLD